MFEVAVLIVLILLNGLFSMSEMALVSSRRPRLQQMAEQGHRGAAMALTLMEKPAAFLSTVQVGITLIGIVAGVYGGATLADQVEPLFLWLFPNFADYAHTVSIGSVVVLITFLSIVFGELVPKRVALVNAEVIAAMMAPPMRGLALLSAPVVWILGKTTEFLLWSLGLHGKTAAPVTEEEVKAMIDEGTEIGVFDPAEKDMIDGVLRLSDRTVRSIMTPRPDVIWIDPTDSLDEIRQEITQTGYSRFLVSAGDIDNVQGIVHAKDLLTIALNGQPLSIAACLKEALFVHDGTQIMMLLEMFRKTHQQMAVVVDEYGGLEGVVTLTDIIESVAGSLPELGEPDDPDIVQRQDGSWLIDGMTPIDDVERSLSLRSLRYENDDFHTIAGFVLNRIGHLPKAGDRFTWHDLTFEVVDMDGRRIDKILVMRDDNDTGVTES